MVHHVTLSGAAIRIATIRQIHATNVGSKVAQRRCLSPRVCVVATRAARGGATERDARGGAAESPRKKRSVGLRCKTSADSQRPHSRSGYTLPIVRLTLNGIVSCWTKKDATHAKDLPNINDIALKSTFKRTFNCNSKEHSHDQCRAH